VKKSCKCGEEGKVPLDIEFKSNEMLCTIRYMSLSRLGWARGNTSGESMEVGECGRIGERTAKAAPLPDEVGGH